MLNRVTPGLCQRREDSTSKGFCCSFKLVLLRLWMRSQLQWDQECSMINRISRVFITGIRKNQRLLKGLKFIQLAKGVRAATFQITKIWKYQAALRVSLQLKTGACIQVPAISVETFQTWNQQAAKCHNSCHESFSQTKTILPWGKRLTQTHWVIVSVSLLAIFTLRGFNHFNQTLLEVLDVLHSCSLKN